MYGPIRGWLLAQNDTTDTPFPNPRIRQVVGALCIVYSLCTFLALKSGCQVSLATLAQKIIGLLFCSRSLMHALSLPENTEHVRHVNERDLWYASLHYVGNVVDT